MGLNLSATHASYSDMSKICKSKQDGGLGIPKLRELNIAIVSKLAWKVAQEVRGSLAANIMAAKYGGWKAMIQGQHEAACSHTDAFRLVC